MTASHVVATTTIAADIAQHVAGPDADVDTLLPESASPHDYAAGAKDRARLEEADLVVAWGGGLEQGLPLDELDNDPLELAAGQDNPHIWMDPKLVALSLPELADALAEADPEHAERLPAPRRRVRATSSHASTVELRRMLSADPARAAQARQLARLARALRGPVRLRVRRRALRHRRPSRRRARRRSPT